MQLFGSRQSQAFRQLTAEYAALKSRADLLDSTCGVGLWEAIMHNGDAMHPQSRWTWSPEFRRLISYASEAEYPNVVQSWSDRLHPDDVEPTFAAFAGHLADKAGRSRYDVTYRLKVRDGSYRWFRATGGCTHHADGTTITACGSLTDVHQQKMVELLAAKDAEADAFAIQALGRGLEAIVSGDLAYRIEEQLSPKLERLKTDFNQAIATLANTLQVVVQTAQTVEAGSQEISASTEDLSKRTEQQAASLEETAAALDEITATVKKTADGAKRAQQVVSTAKSDAEHSGKVVGQAVEAMNAIEQSAKQVSQIIGVIDEIAFQTNLLALNAGVEAARAGEAGRGFAVVASEVRALAQRSAEAAKEIKTLISASGQQVSQGVALVGETGTSLGRIVSHVAGINGIVSEIAASAQEQAAGLDQVNTAINQMDQVTQQNAAMVEESTAASHRLAQETLELTDLVGRVNLGSAMTGSSVTRIRPIQKRSATVRSMRTLGNGGAAPKIESAAVEANWEEF